MANDRENKLKQETELKRWYALTNNEVCEELNVDPRVGLTSQEAQRRLEKDGPNKLEEAKETPVWLVFLKTLVDPLAIIMLISGFLSFILPLSFHQQFDAPDIAGIVVIFGVVLANSIISTIQEVKAHKSLNALKSMAEPKTIVLRDGIQMEIPVEEIVRGDVVFLETGKFIPADIRIIESPKLKVDESALTGESLPVEKVTEALRNKEMVLGDQINLGFMSTFITDGRAVGIVFATGKYSAVGKIASSIANTKQKKTPLQRKLTQATFLISILSAILATGIFLLSYLLSLKGATIFDLKLNPGAAGYQKELLTKSIIFALSAGVALIPESIMIIVTITLSMSARKMAKRNVIVKTFGAVETLGAVNVICSDKTGTLTQNKMTIEHVLLNNEIIDAKKFEYNAKDELQKQFINSLILCSDSISGGATKIGDPTELALTDWTLKLGFDETLVRENNPRIDEIPFDSERKLMTTVCDVDGTKLVYTKGAVDQLFKRCTKIYLNGQIVTLTEEIKQQITDRCEEFYNGALRVLGFAYKEFKKTKNPEYDVEEIFLGCVAMMDPPRDEAKTAIKRAHDSGIRVIMITGDHKMTAIAIGKRIGLIDDKYSEGLTGEEIDQLNDVEFDEKLEHVNVFARVNPEHKTRIVEALQRKDLIVAMTGDGVNDSPSLAKADVGLAMGITGTDVAKESAKVILADDNFATIISGVREGRNVYEKIKRSIAFLIGSNLSQILTILLLLAIPPHISPLGNINVLWHILAVETILAMPIGMAHSKEQLMMYRPRNEKESVYKYITLEILSIALWNTVFAVIAFYAINAMTGNVNMATTGVYIVIIFAPIFYAWTSKTRNYTVKISREKCEKLRLNEWMLYGMILALILNLMTLFVPGIRDFFGVKALLTPEAWILAFVLSLMPFVFKTIDTWVYKMIYIKRHDHEIHEFTFNFRRKQIRDNKRKKREKVQAKKAAKRERLRAKKQTQKEREQAKKAAKREKIKMKRLMKEEKIKAEREAKREFKRIETEAKEEIARAKEELVKRKKTTKKNKKTIN